MEDARLTGKYNLPSPELVRTLRVAVGVTAVNAPCMGHAELSILSPEKSVSPDAYYIFSRYTLYLISIVDRTRACIYDAVRSTPIIRIAVRST